MKITKKCSRCGKILLTCKFYKNRSKKDGFSCWCKNCTNIYWQKHREENIKRNREYRIKHTEKVKAYKKKYNLKHIKERRKYDDKYYQENKEKRKVYAKKYNLKHKEKRSKYDKEYYLKHKKEKIKKDKERYQADINFRLKFNLRHRTRKVLRNNKCSLKTMELLGCTFEEFKKHLSKQFQKGMTFKNYKEWHIDHIIPCRLFDLSQPEEQKQCFNYKNLQPLWAIDNLKKGGKGARQLNFLQSL